MCAAKPSPSGSLPSATDWARAPASTVVCDGVLLRDVVQAIMDGFDTPDAVRELLGVSETATGADGTVVPDEIPAILDVFVPVVNAWKSGSVCGGACASCGGGCGVEDSLA